MIEYKRKTYIMLATLLFIVIILLLVIHSFNYTSESGKQIRSAEEPIYYGD